MSGGLSRAGLGRFDRPTTTMSGQVRRSRRGFHVTETGSPPPIGAAAPTMSSVSRKLAMPGRWHVLTFAKETNVREQGHIGGGSCSVFEVPALSPGRFEETASVTKQEDAGENENPADGRADGDAPRRRGMQPARYIYGGGAVRRGVAATRRPDHRAQGRFVRRELADGTRPRHQHH